MAFYYSPLDLYYSISISVRNDQLNAKKLEGLNDYLIVKEEINKMFKFLRNTIKYSWYGYIDFYFGFNDNSWYIFKYKETEDKTYYYIFGIQLKIVCSFENQFKFIEKSNEIYNYINNYFKLYSEDDLKIESTEETRVIIANNKETFDLFEKYLSKINSVREEKEREDYTKINRQRYFTIEDREKYNTLLDVNDINDKRFFEYIDMKFY